MYSLKEFSAKTVRRYGEVMQITKAIEELSELITELSRGLLGDNLNIHAVLTEIADVKIMIDCLEYIYELDDEIEAEMQRKMQREVSRWAQNQS